MRIPSLVFDVQSSGALSANATTLEAMFVSPAIATKCMRGTSRDGDANHRYGLFYKGLWQCCHKRILYSFSRGE